MLHSHDTTLVLLSVLIAIVASYTALDLVNSIAIARGKARLAWLAGGAMAMGVGIWSMHFVGMLAFRLSGVSIAYDIPLLLLSVWVAIVASALALYLVSRPKPPFSSLVLDSLIMGAAIAGMHYIGIASMRMPVEVVWNLPLVLLSILIAVIASFAALQIACKTRDDLSTRGFWKRVGGGIVMGIAIAGMHYTAMAAMFFYPGPAMVFQSKYLLATEGLAIAVVGTSLLILGIAVSGSIMDRALSRRAAVAEQVQSILESITDGFYSVDRQWRITYANHIAQASFLNYRTGDGKSVIGRVIWEIVPGLSGTGFERTYREAMHTRHSMQVEEFFTPQQKWIEARAYPSSKGLSIYFRDVSERKDHERAMQEAIRARDEFLSIASHELKTPLTSLKIQAQLRQRSLAKGDLREFQPEALAPSLESDNRQIERLTRLIDDMLDISRINTGKLSLQLERFDLCELAKDVLNRFAGQFEASGCAADFEASSPAWGNWDRFRIEQAFTNLLTNATRYGHGKPIHIRVRSEGGWAFLSVQDEGIGIPPQDQERIFQRFERAAPPTEHRGLGLGLYIVREILAMHGGSVRVASELGQGAEFTLGLPLDAAP